MKKVERVMMLFYYVVCYMLIMLLFIMLFPMSNIKVFQVSEYFLEKCADSLQTAEIRGKLVNLLFTIL